MTIDLARPLSTLQLLSLAEDVAHRTSRKFPLVSVHDLQNEMVNVVVRHAAGFHGLSQRQARWVLTQFGIRFAATRRTEHFERTDHFVYWPNEVASAKSDIRDFEGIAEYRVQAVRRYQWGLDPAVPEQMGKHIPSWAHGRGLADYLIAVADVQLAMRQMASDRGFNISILCEVLNKHNQDCAAHAKELTGELQE